MENKNSRLKAKSGGVLWTVPFLIIFFVNIATSTTLQLYNNSMSIYIVEKLGGLAQFAGMTLTFFTVSSVTTRIIAGRLLDKLSHKRILLVGLILFGIANLAFAFFPQLEAMPYLRFFQGIGFAVATTAASVCVTDVLPKERMTEGIGYFGLGTSVAQAVGPTTALALISGGNFNLIFYFAFGLITLTAILFLISLRFEKDEKVQKTETLPNPEIAEPKNKALAFFGSLLERKALPCTIVQLTLSITNAVSVAFLTLYAKKTGIAQPGMFFILFAVCVVFARLFFGKLADKYGPLSTLIPGTIIYAMAYALLFFSKDVEACYYIAGILAGLGSGLTVPTLNAHAVKSAPEGRRGAAIATYMLSLDAGIGIGSWLWGIIIDASGFDMMFIGSIICCLVALGLSVLFFRKDRITKKT